MSENSETFQADLTTFNEKLIHLAARKERFGTKPLSEIARIFNRSLAEVNYNPRKIRKRGKFEENIPFVNVYRTLDLPLLTITAIDGRKLAIQEMIVARSPEIVKEIDAHFEDFRRRDKSNENDLSIPIRVGAIITALYGALHPFLDGNGRTAVALLGYVIEANHALEGKEVLFDIEKFGSFPEHSVYMTFCGLTFSPHPYTIDDMFSRFQQGELNVNIHKELGNGPKRDQFIKSFLDNIRKFVNRVNWKTGEIKLSKDELPSLDYLMLGLEKLEELIKKSLSVK